MNDTEFLSHIVKSLVNFPDDVYVERVVDEMGVLLTLSVNAEDMGRIIGRQGITAQALRTIIRIFGMKNESRTNLKINNPKEL